VRVVRSGRVYTLKIELIDADGGREEEEGTERE
jgi:hypothetical protein